jgi:hypothetical protein
LPVAEKKEAAMANNEGESKRVKARPGKKKGRVRKDPTLEAGQTANEVAPPRKGKQARTAGGTPIIQKEVT